MSFSETTKGYASKTFNTLCSDSSFGFSGSLYAGTYSVRISGVGDNYSNIPYTATAYQGYVANPGLVVAANNSSLVFDVKTVPVSGRLTFNAKAPVLGSSCTASPDSNSAQVNFTESTFGYGTTLNVSCRDNTFGFTGLLYQGTYTVRVNNPGGLSYDNLPAASTIFQSYVAAGQLKL